MRGRLLYAGSFDPITSGHFDLIKRASKMTPELIIGVLDNQSKTPYYSVEERCDMIRLATEEFENIKIDSFSGLLADYVKKEGFEAVIRGLRATMDFEYEIQMAQMNAHLLDHEVETIFLMTSPDYSFLSSSLVKEVFKLGGNVEEFVPKSVYDYMVKNRK